MTHSVTKEALEMFVDDVGQLMDVLPTAFTYDGFLRNAHNVVILDRAYLLTDNEEFTWCPYGAFI